MQSGTLGQEENRTGVRDVSSRKMTSRAPFPLLLALVLTHAPCALGQTAPAADSPAQGVTGEDAPLPEIHALLLDTERNQKRMEALRKDYTYHVHTDSETLDKDGGVKKTETEDAESLTLDGIRVNRVVARNGKPLTPDEQQKENDRLDKDVARAKERRAKAASKGTETDENGQAELSLARILELGTFTHERRVEFEGRPTIVLDYEGDPSAKTHNAFEGVFRDLSGTVWIDEADRVLVRGEGRLVRDFKLGGGLVADVRKDTRFDFQSHRLDDGVWLFHEVHGDGSARVFLLANFHGRMHMEASDYRRFRSSATIVGSHGVIGPDGQPLPGSSLGRDTREAKPASPAPSAPAGQPQR